MYRALKKGQAFNSNPGSFCDGVRSLVAGKSLHSHALIDQSILNGVVVIAVVLWLLNIFGLLISALGRDERIVSAS